MFHANPSCVILLDPLLVYNKKPEECYLKVLHNILNISLGDEANISRSWFWFTCFWFKFLPMLMQINFLVAKCQCFPSSTLKNIKLRFKKKARENLNELIVLLEIKLHIYIYSCTHGVMVIIIGNGLGNTSSNPGQDWLHFT